MVDCWWCQWWIWRIVGTCLREESGDSKTKFLWIAAGFEPEPNWTSTLSFTSFFVLGFAGGGWLWFSKYSNSEDNGRQKLFLASWTTCFSLLFRANIIDFLVFDSICVLDLPYSIVLPTIVFVSWLIIGKRSKLREVSLQLIKYLWWVNLFLRGKQLCNVHYLR